MAHPTSRLVYGLVGASLLLAACTTKKQETPSLTGPSELSIAIAIAASPDVLAQDGASQSLITITAYDSNGQLLRNLPLRAEISVDGFITDFGSLSARNIVTDSTGRAFVTYTAPPPPPIFVDAGTIVHIRVVPAGTNADNATTRFASIRLVPPGVIGAPPSPFRPDFLVPSAVVGDTAVFSATVVDASGADVTNQIASYTWNFGDGDTATGRTVSHTFDDPRVFAVSLVIVDALGRRATVSHPVSVAQGLLPTAVWDFSPKPAIIDQTINFNALASTAAAGHRVTGYSWTFGDGTSAGGPQPTHVYHTAGTYSVTLIVTDDAGRDSLATTKDVPVASDAPKAVFTITPSAPTAPTGTDASVVFDGSGSTAAPGRTIVSYSWRASNGATGSGPVVSGFFRAPGTYTMTLTVTDNAGKTNTVTQVFTVAAT